MMRVLVCGGRNFNNVYQLDEAMKLLPVKPLLIVHGGARGADVLAGQWAKHNGVWSVQIDALWDAHGKSAGHRRNQVMLDIIKPEYCVAFPGGAGTQDMVRRCEKAGIVVWRPYS